MTYAVPVRDPPDGYHRMAKRRTDLAISSSFVVLVNRDAVKLRQVPRNVADEDSRRLLRRGVNDTW
jgi:hypothetical protein